ncbi:TIGR02281 family clan AA aspartic protease [Meridianimarinicoccus roseus]|jgi:aspartyl protease family protein|uniref:TIGR02281 family clan AA aspartic protease n=1 Tax=Meridianimarinicoccus roseus TaxID=2072018 RepID=A0A2V2LCZ4_9RHOB|nr:TIGR02281 family clan AA aspartic protease [Meridianimarinicoccus roseus]PWR03235.1 TIGR02281 family clan AA aspartic protease [Meridianimarinicoccus roseus]
MTADSIASLIYLSLLGTVIAGYFLLANRHRMGKIAQQGAIWALIFIGVAAGAALWDDIRSTSASLQSVYQQGDRIEVTRSPDGHYHLTLGVNGTPVEFLVDTGASEMVLSVQDAERVGIAHADLRFTGRAATANGTVQTARITLDRVELGGQVDRNVPAQVSGGAMPASLLGMTYLSRFASLSITGDTLTLIR